VHRRERRETEPFGGDARKTRTRVAVAARAEGGPGDEHVGPLGLEQAEQHLERLLLVLGEVVVAAGERGDDVESVESRGQAAARPHGTVETRRLGLRGLLAAEPGEELVQVVDGSHQATALSECCPIWFVAPR
jgi:hypothetical protein